MEAMGAWEPAIVLEVRPRESPADLVAGRFHSSNLFIRQTLALNPDAFSNEGFIHLTAPLAAVVCHYSMLAIDLLCPLKV